MPEDMGDKTELPTQRRIEQARDKGQIAKSTELVAAVDLVTAALMLWFFGTVLAEVCGGLLRDSLSPGSPLEMADPTAAWGAVGRAFWRVTPVAAASLLTLLLVTVLAYLQQVRLVVSTKSLEPKLERLNPVEGFQRMFNRRNLVRSGLNLLKLSLIVAVVYAAYSARARQFASLPSLEMLSALRLMFRLVLEIAAYILAILLVVGVADYAYQRWQHLQDLMMTKQQLKDERKETDGDAEIKSRVQRMGREIAMGKLKREVPTADVIVTNPTHYAIALRYDAGRMAAPVVVAKGVDFMAFRIREVAIASGVPIVEKPELARGLYKHVKVGRQIDERFFAAVAEVLAYVYRLQGKAA